MANTHGDLAAVTLLSKSTKSDVFAQKFPDRFCNVGIAEANLAGIAAGMAVSGLIPFVSTFAVFARA